MDCNKEEALKAKGIAEKKMERKDFTGGRKFALKAQQLYPDLENIAQMLVVCEVHCSAEQKLLGNVVNWYKILQVDLTADDAIIKKQYRKFALQLHPDKNKFPGAEAAFKLIVDAQKMLLDREKRSSLDTNLRRFPMSRTSMPSYHQQNVQMKFNPVMQTNVKPNFTNLNPLQQQQSRQPTQQGLNGVCPTFWTACSSCSVRYEYRREVLNRSLRCIQCSSPFIAYEVDAQSATPTVNSTQQTFVPQNINLNHDASKIGVGSQSSLPTRRSRTEKGSTSDVSKRQNGKRGRKRAAESSESSESIGSTDSEDDTFSNNDGFAGVSSDREMHPRRSARRKDQVSYKENVSDDELVPLKRGKRSGTQSSDSENLEEEAEMNDQNGVAADLKDDQKEVKQEQKNCSEETLDLENANVKNKEVREKEKVGSSKIDEVPEHSTSKSTNPPYAFVYPDPEFSDFDKDKQNECFSAGQIWALYDSTDGMPRFYAIINKVLSPGFKLQIRWFETAPDDEDEIEWVNEDLPSACGKYKLANPQIIEDLPMFSHQIVCEKISRVTYKVYPRKEETWALFKNWDIKWYMDAESHRQYDFEFVEILSDYVEGVGVAVAYLAKLKGFVSLFSRIVKGGNDSFQIPSDELFRFSHRVPSFKMTGQERVGVPVGSYELDPVSLPMNLEEIAVDNLEVKVGLSPSIEVSTRFSDVLKSMKNSEGEAATASAPRVSTRSSDVLKFMRNPEGDAATTSAPTANVKLGRSDSAEEKKDPVVRIDDASAPSASVTESIQVPGSKFYNFDAAERSIEKFQIGQIWAFYSNEDELPKYYGQIKRVRTSPDVQLQVNFLTNCWLPESAIRYEDKDMHMLISCGRFKIKPGARTCSYSNTDTVSHHLRVSTIGKNKEFEIFPRTGEVWALYKAWTHKLKGSDLLNCEYDLVEIVEENDSWTDVLPLEKVSDYDSVFKGKFNKGKRPLSMTISRSELLRFSHQIPAFKLTEEHGNLRGFWELDLAAIPAHYPMGYKKCRRG